MKREGAAVTDTQNYESGFITQQLGKGKTILRIMLKKPYCKEPVSRNGVVKGISGALRRQSEG